MKINYSHAKKICSADEFALIEQCKPRTLTKFSEAELTDKIKEVKKMASARKEESSAISKEVRVLLAEAENRLETRLARKKLGFGAKGKKSSIVSRKGQGDDPLSLRQRSKQKGRLTDQRIKKSGLDSRVRGHVSARGRRKEAVRDSRGK